MGSEVPHRFFDADDFSQFRQCLDAETALLKTMFDEARFSRRGDVAGFELEAWLVDENGDPVAGNERFLTALNSPLVVPELAKFNIELNGSPCALTGRVFSRLHDELSATWSRCCEVADSLGWSIIAIGTLPTAREEIFVDENMSGMLRYKSLNDRVMALRDGKKLEINIDGRDSLSIEHQDVMLEAAATSFQIHLQCYPENAVRDFNASLIAAAPLVAIGANSPFLFGHSLWDESRIPLFEQAVNVGEHNKPRVTFGDGYVQDTMFEIFDQNCVEHMILLPVVEPSPANRFSHLRFQNGTMWRWVRPLIGFDFDGQAHLRLEQRVPSAGPTIFDCVANAAFYYGLVRGLGLEHDAPERKLDFLQAKQNFYAAARYGLGAQICWWGESGISEVSIQKLIVEKLVPLASLGLQSLGIPDEDISRFLSVISDRAENAQNGAAWQRRWIALNGGSMHELVAAYWEQQQTERPVHTWPL